MSLVNKKINDTLLLISAISCTFIGHINCKTSCSVLFWTQNILCFYYLSITLLSKCVLGNILIFLSPIHDFKGNLARHYILWSALVFPEMLPSVVWDLVELFSAGLKSQIFGDICMRLYFFSQVVLFLYFFIQICLRSWEPGKVIVHQWLDLCTAEKSQNISDVPSTAQRVSPPKLGLKLHVFLFSADTGSLLTSRAEQSHPAQAAGWLAWLAGALSLPQAAQH